MIWTDFNREVLRLRRAGHDVDADEITKLKDRVYCPTCHRSWEGRHGLAQLLRMANAYPGLESA